jgi:hypothetical protein
MTQDEHIAAYMDVIDLRIAEALHELADEASRQVNLRHGVTRVVAEGDAGVLAIETLHGPYTRPVEVAHTDYLAAKYRLGFRRRWMESNGPIKRVRSEHVRAQIDNYEVRLAQLLPDLTSDNQWTQAQAWSALTHG